MLPKIKITAIRKTTLDMCVALFIIKGAGFLKDVLIAKYFGLNELVDVYIYSLLVPLLCYSTIFFSFNNYFIPNYLRIKTLLAGRELKQYAFYVFGIFSVLVMFSAVFFALGLPQILTSMNKELFGNQALVASFYQFSFWASAYFLFFTLTSLLSVLLQAEHHYNYSIYPQVLIPIVSVILVITTHQVWGLSSVLYGLTWGSVGAFLISLWLVVRMNLMGFHLTKSIVKNFKKHTKIRQFWYLFIAGIFPNLIDFIDRNMATFLGAGKLSILSYGQSIPVAILSIVTLGLGTAIFSHLSQWVIKDEKHKVINSIQKGIIFSTILLIPFCYFNTIYAKDIITVLFERGRFTSENSFFVSQVFQVYIYTIYFNLLLVLAYKVISSLNKNQFIAFFFAGLFLVKLLLNIVLVKAFNIIGLPISTVITNFMGCIVIFMFINLHIPFFDLAFKKKLTMIMVVTGIFCLVYSGANQLLYNFVGGHNFYVGIVNYCILFPVFLLIVAQYADLNRKAN